MDAFIRRSGRKMEESLRAGKSNAREREKVHPRGPPVCDVTADRG